MKKINLEETPHKFKRIKEFPKGSIEVVDYYQCKCGMTGRKPNSAPILYVSDIFTDEQVDTCKSFKVVDTYIGKKVKITNTILHETLNIYRTFTPGSIHPVVKAPFPFLNGENGMWFQGAKGVIKLSNFDFEFIPNRLQRTK